MRADRLTDVITHHGEGPCWADWSPAEAGLRLVDMLAGAVLSLGDDGSITRRQVGEIAACVRPRAGGGAVIAIERGLALEEPDGTVRALPPMWTDRSVRMNEGGVAPDGSLYVGSMAYDQAPGAAALYRVRADLTVSMVLPDVTVSNGIGWSPSGEHAYYNDTATGQIALFDMGPLGLSRRRVFAEVDGHPDGLAVDADGGVWTAIFGGGRVERRTSGGVLDAVVEIGARQVTACAFGGPDLDRLYITTSREGLADGDDPAAGSVFVCEPGVRGLPVTPFAG